MKKLWISSLWLVCILVPLFGFLDSYSHLTSQAQGQIETDRSGLNANNVPQESQKVLLRVPVGDGSTYLAMSALVHADITEIVLIPIIEQNQVTGARVVVLDQDHTVRVVGESLVLDLPSGQATIGGTFSITGKDGRTMFAVKLDDKPLPGSESPSVAEDAPITPEIAGEKPVKPAKPPVEGSPDATIQDILKPKKTDEKPE